VSHSDELDNGWADGMTDYGNEDDGSARKKGYRGDGVYAMNHSLEQAVALNVRGH
jgi:hypothetical protein